MKILLIRKIITLVVTLSFLWQDIAWTAPIGQPSAISPQPLAIFIPEQYGVIEKSQVSSRFYRDKSQVILIKDAHCNYEAQTNIARILDILIRDYNVGLVCVEGAEGLVNTSPYNAFPDQEAREKVTDRYVKKGVLSASEALGISRGNKQPFTIWGVEDSRLYLEDFKAFRETFKENAGYIQTINQLIKAVNPLKDRIYNPGLLKFDRQYVEYEENKISLSDWIKKLSKEYGVRSKNFNLALKAIKLEGEIDFKKAESERAQLIKDLEKTLPKEGLQELVKQSLLFKLGKIPAIEYYDYLGHFSLPFNLRKYIRLIRIQSRIDSDELFKELSCLESTIYSKLCQTEVEKKLHKIDYNLKILNKLLNLQISRQELEYYKENINEFSLDKIKEFMDIQHKEQLKIDVPEGLSLQSAERFYELAIQRDKVLVSKLLSKMEKDKKQNAAMVIGGFHAEGIIKRLEDEGISYLVISPKITKIQEDSPYLSIMLDEKIDIDKLLENISLAPPLPLGNIGNPEARKRLASALIGSRNLPLDRYTGPAREALQALCTIAGIAFEEERPIAEFLQPLVLADRIISEENPAFAAFLLELLMAQVRENTAVVKQALRKVVTDSGNPEIVKLAKGYIITPEEAEELKQRLWAHYQTTESGRQNGEIHYSHTMRLTPLAMELARQNNADMDILIAAVILHDISKEDGRLTPDGKPHTMRNLIEHHIRGAIKAREILTKMGKDSEFISRVEEAILRHMGPMGKYISRTGQEQISFMEFANTRLIKDEDRDFVESRTMQEPNDKESAILYIVDMMDMMADGITKITDLRQQPGSFFLKQDDGYAAQNGISNVVSVSAYYSPNSAYESLLACGQNIERTAKRFGIEGAIGLIGELKDAVDTFFKELDWEGINTGLDFARIFYRLSRKSMYQQLIIRQLLSESDIGRHLDSETIDELARHPEIKLEVHARGEEVVKEGDAPGSIYLIVSGELAVISIASGDTGVLGKSDLFGETAVLTNQPQSATAVVRSGRAVLIRLTSKAIEGFRTQLERLPLLSPVIPFPAAPQEPLPARIGAGRTKKWIGIDSGAILREAIVKEDRGIVKNRDKKEVLDLMEQKLGSRSTTYKALRNSRAVDSAGNTIDIEFRWGILTNGVEAYSVRDGNKLIIYLDHNFIETVPEEDKPLVTAQLIHHEIAEQIEGKTHTQAVLAEFELEDDSSKPISMASEIILENTIQDALGGNRDSQAYLKGLTENTANAVQEIENNRLLNRAERERLIDMAYAIHDMIKGDKYLIRLGIIPLIRFISGLIRDIRAGWQYLLRRIARPKKIQLEEKRRSLIDALERGDRTIEFFFKEILPLYLHLLNNDESNPQIDELVTNLSSRISEYLKNYILQIQSIRRNKEILSSATDILNTRYLIDNGYYLHGLSVEGDRVLFNFSRVVGKREENRIRVLFIEGLVIQNEKQFDNIAGYSTLGRAVPDVIVLADKVRKISREGLPAERPRIWQRILAERLQELQVSREAQERFLYDYLYNSYAAHEMQHKNIERQEPIHSPVGYGARHLEQISELTREDDEMSSFLAQFISGDARMELAYLLRYLSGAEDLIRAIHIYERRVREYKEEKNILIKLFMWLFLGNRYVSPPKPVIEPHIRALLTIIDKFYEYAGSEGRITQGELDLLKGITDPNQRLMEMGEQLFYRTEAGDLRRYALMLFEEGLPGYSMGFNGVDRLLLKIQRLLRTSDYTDAMRLLNELPIELEGLALRDSPSGQIIRLVQEQIELIPAGDINIKRKLQTSLRRFVEALGNRDARIRTKLEEPDTRRQAVAAAGTKSHKAGTPKIASREATNEDVDYIIDGFFIQDMVVGGFRADTARQIVNEFTKKPVEFMDAEKDSFENAIDGQIRRNMDRIVAVIEEAKRSGLLDLQLSKLTSRRQELRGQGRDTTAIDEHIELLGDFIRDPLDILNERLGSAYTLILKGLDFLVFNNPENYWVGHSSTSRNAIYLPELVYDQIKGSPEALAAFLIDELVDTIVGEHTSLSDKLISLLDPEEKLAELINRRAYLNDGVVDTLAEEIIKLVNSNQSLEAVMAVDNALGKTISPSVLLAVLEIAIEKIEPEYISTFAFLISGSRRIRDAIFYLVSADRIDSKRYSPLTRAVHFIYGPLFAPSDFKWLSEVLPRFKEEKSIKEVADYFERFRGDLQKAKRYLATLLLELSPIEDYEDFINGILALPIVREIYSESEYTELLDQTERKIKGLSPPPVRRLIIRPAQIDIRTYPEKKLREAGYDSTDDFKYELFLLFNETDMLRKSLPPSVTPEMLKEAVIEVSHIHTSYHTLVSLVKVRIGENTHQFVHKKLFNFSYTLLSDVFNFYKGLNPQMARNTLPEQYGEWITPFSRDPRLIGYHRTEEYLTGFSVYDLDSYVSGDSEEYKLAESLVVAAYYNLFINVAGGRWFLGDPTPDNAGIALTEGRLTVKIVDIESRIVLPKIPDELIDGFFKTWLINQRISGEAVQRFSDEVIERGIRMAKAGYASVSSIDSTAAANLIEFAETGTWPAPITKPIIVEPYIHEAPTGVLQPALSPFAELEVIEDKARGTSTVVDIPGMGANVETGLGLPVKIWDRPEDRDLNNLLLENLDRLLKNLPKEERDKFLTALVANAPPEGLVLAILDKSQHLGENCQRDGFIGANRDLLLKLRDATGQPDMDALSNLLQVILYHELRHEAGEKDELRLNLRDIALLDSRGIDILIRLKLLRPESKFKRIADVVNEISRAMEKYGTKIDDTKKEGLKKALLNAYEGRVQINLLELMNMLAERIAPENIFQLTAEIAEPINRFLGSKEATKGGQMVAAVLQEILELMPIEVETEEDKLLKTIQALASEKGIDPNAMQSVFDLFKSGLEILAVDPSYKLDSNYFILISQIEKLTGVDDKKIIEVFSRRGLAKERAEPVPNSPLAQEVEKLGLYIELNNMSIRADLDLGLEQRRGLFYLDNLNARIEKSGDIQFLSSVDAVNKDLARAYSEVQASPGGGIIDRKEKITLVVSADTLVSVKREGRFLRFSYKPGIQALLRILANSKNIHIVIRADGEARQVLEEIGILNKQVTVVDTEKKLTYIRTDAALSDWAKDEDHVVFLLTPEEGDVIDTKGMKAFGIDPSAAFHAALLFAVTYAQAQTTDEIVTAINSLKLLGMAPGKVDEIVQKIKEEGLGFFTVKLVRIEETLKEFQNRRLYIEVAA